MNDSIPLLDVCSIMKQFKKKSTIVEALKPLSFTVSKGEILGVVGESGSGKSTLLRLLTRLDSPTGGQINLYGKDIVKLHGKDTQDVYRNIQMIFQNPAGSFNPRRKLRSSIIENMQRLLPYASKAEHNLEIDRLLERVGISVDLADRYPHNLSGGQCQRVAIARALSTKPRILLCDEITSALDVSAQARVIKLLLEFNKELGVAIIFVSHDLSLACNFCENVMVLYRGSCVESGNSGKIVNDPNHVYTKELLASVIDPIDFLERKRSILHAGSIS